MTHTKKVLWSILALFVPAVMYCTLYAGDKQAFTQIPRLTLTSLWPGQSTDKDDVTTNEHQANVTQLKKILFWNDFFGKQDYYFGTGRQPFLDAGCPVNTCIITYDRSLFKMEELDALIWHARSQDTSLPSTRFAHTSYVFFVEESPKNLLYDLRHFNNVFNLTMTYRRDSDIFAPYGRFELLPEAERAKESSSADYAHGKTKMAAWFVSNCKTGSEREILVSRLQEHLPVDIYGTCGPLSCNKQHKKQCYDIHQWYTEDKCTDNRDEKFNKLFHT